MWSLFTYDVWPCNAELQRWAAADFSCDKKVWRRVFNWPSRLRRKIIKNTNDCTFFGYIACGIYIQLCILILLFVLTCTLVTAKYSNLFQKNNNMIAMVRVLILPSHRGWRFVVEPSCTIVCNWESAQWVNHHHHHHCFHPCCCFYFIMYLTSSRQSWWLDLLCSASSRSWPPSSYSYIISDLLI